LPKKAKKKPKKKVKRAKPKRKPKARKKPAPEQVEPPAPPLETIAGVLQPPEGAQPPVP